MIKAGTKKGSILVIGGGVAGMQAALDAAQAGFKVYIAERESALGGQMSALDKTFPTNDCAMCMLSPRLVEIANNPNVEILTLAEVTALEGEPGDFTVTLKRRPRFVDTVKCTACGDCLDVCPVEIDDPFNQNLATRKAIGRRYPQAVPSAFAIERAGLPRCRLSCPAGTNVQGYIALAAKGRFLEAYDLIRETNPFISVCGRVCYHPCESECTRSAIDGSVAVMALKRYIADKVRSDNLLAERESAEPDAAKASRKVAVVGAGPAGLTAAMRLAEAGYSVKVFDQREKPGGMMRYGIPAYRLPKDELDFEIGEILKTGVEFQGGFRLGRDATVESLQAAGYDAVFVAIGAWKGITLGIDGENAPGVRDALRFLEEVNSGADVPVGKNVVVIGGGDAAMDAARTAVRLGASRVTILYRRSRDEMPASAEEQAEAEAEGVVFEFLAAPESFIVKDTRVEGIRAIRMALGEPDESGRKRPVPVKGSAFEVPADTVIVAISQAVDADDISSSGAVNATDWRTLAVDPVTLAASAPGVFAGGDVVTGPATAIAAVAAGNRAARSIANLLEGRPLDFGQPPAELEPLPPLTDATIEEARLAMRSKAPRREMPLAPVAERTRDFREVALGFDDETARAEAARCLSCGVCSDCRKCELVCEARAINFDDAEREETLHVGAVILASGLSPYEARRAGEYGYGRYPNVVTSVEYERMLSASGPTFGHVKRPSDGRPPARIAFIQCVGSRGVTDSANPWCSGVCCMYTAKEAVVTKEHNPDADISVFYIDIRAHGKGYEKYRDAAEKTYGVKYIRSMPSTVKESKKTGNLFLRHVTDDSVVHDDEFDLVVLAVGMESAPGSAETAKALGIAVNEYGFPETLETSPAETSRKGIFAAGVAVEPADIPESVTAASAAAASAGQILADARGTEIAPQIFPQEKEVAGSEERIGVFICHCGNNIADTVDVTDLAEYARGLDGVVIAEDIMYSCSPDGLDRIKTAIREQNLNRVVVSSCSPRTHEPIFRRALREEGLNPYLFELANIRDQCSWVHKDDKAAATDKARDLVRGSVARAALLEPLRETEVPVTPRALVLGAGAAGMAAALSLAGQGFPVTLVEKDDSLGGNLRQISQSVWGLDFADYLAKTTAAVRDNPAIDVLTGSTLVSQSGYIGNFESVVKTPSGDVTVLHGATIVATGAAEYAPTEYLYGHKPRVVTQREFEAKLAADPGVAVGREDRAIVMIQCVGSRDDDRPYCSRVCCSEAVKNALEVKRVSPATPVVILYRDVRTFGFKEELYRRAREAGVLFIRYTPERKPEVVAGEGPLTVKVFDNDLQDEVVIEAGTVVLSAGIVPNADAADVSRIMKLPLTGDGFFLEAHMKLRPVDFATDGIYLCGLAHGPKLFSEAVTQALGAAGRAATVLARKTITVGGSVAVVDEDLCAACLTCVRLCPYEVPVIKDSVASIEPAKCQGCGVCAAACPAKAIELLHFKDAQVVAVAQALAARVT